MILASDAIDQVKLKFWQPIIIQHKPTRRSFMLSEITSNLNWKNENQKEFKTATTTTTTPTEWVLHRLITRKETYSQVYPMLYKIAQVCTTMPVSNAWPERGVSTLWRVKTCV